MNWQARKRTLKAVSRKPLGTLTGNKDLESEGANERAGGAAQERIGRATRKVGEAIEDLGKKIKR